MRDLENVTWEEIVEMMEDENYDMSNVSEEEAVAYGAVRATMNGYQDSDEFDIEVAEGGYNLIL